MILRQPTAPTTSVVITCFNYGHYLAAAIDSVLAQTRPSLEILVVDDGSTDDTAAVAAPYVRRHAVQYLPQTHGGQAKAKNLGVARSRGDWIAFLDADDRWHPAKLEKQWNALRAHPDAGVCYTSRTWITPEGHFLPRAETRQLPSGRILAPLFYDNIICFSSALVRREAFERHGPMDEGLRLGIDYDLWLRIAREYAFVCVPEALVLYRTGHASLSRAQEERSRTALFIMNRFLQDAGGRDLLPVTLVKRAFAATYANYAWSIRDLEPARALTLYRTALRHMPLYLPAWKGIAATLAKKGIALLRHPR